MRRAGRRSRRTRAPSTTEERKAYELAAKACRREPTAEHASALIEAGAALDRAQERENESLVASIDDMLKEVETILDEADKRRQTEIMAGRPAATPPHLSWGRVPALLRYAPWRVSCARYGVKVERVPWAAGGGVFTSDFEELAAYLAQVTDRTAVSRLLGVSWLAVGNIVERVVSRRLDGARFTRLKRIGIDEFSYRKRHCYLTVVVDHDTRRVVWAGAGRSAETLGAFFEQLGPGGCARLELVTVDLASTWQKALAAWAPHARVVFDRFHVERLAADAVDEVRRAEQRRLAPAEAKALKGARYPLLKRPDRLKPGEVRRLETLRRANRALDRACELKDYLAMILGQATSEGAQELLDEWLEWAARSRLKPFVKLAGRFGSTRKASWRIWTRG